MQIGFASTVIETQNHESSFLMVAAFVFPQSIVGPERKFVLMVSLFVAPQTNSGPVKMVKYDEHMLCAVLIHF